MNSLTTYSMRTCASIVLVLLCSASTPTPVEANAPSTAIWSLDFEQRVAAQRAIEEVYWRHRIWPQQSAAPKPALSAVMPDDTIRAKVDDYLRKSNALATWWHRPITAKQLQAELDRMSRQTRDAGMLRELFAALGEQPFQIAETLARQTLVERLIRSWYAHDERFHGDTKREAERALLAVEGSVADMKSLGGDYVATKFVRREAEEIVSPEPREDGGIELGPDGWAEKMADLGRSFLTTSDAIPLERMSMLQEESDRFFVVAVLSLAAHAMTVAVVSWPKRSFDAWWSEARRALSTDGAPEHDSHDGRPLQPIDGQLDTDIDTSTGASVPAARCGHTAVWTGTEMVVWGGGGDCFSSAADWNTGGRYKPSTDSWSVTSTGANVPAKRAAHAAVWTGTEMVVWGGIVLGNPVNTGGRYKPSTDSWTATALASSTPAGRRSHTAVWTGSEMIVWGGTRGSFQFDTGGRYKPSTNSWSPTSTATNVPAARSTTPPCGPAAR